MHVFDPNAYGRPKSKAALLLESISKAQAGQPPQTRDSTATVPQEISASSSTTRAVKQTDGRSKGTLGLGDLISHDRRVSPFQESSEVLATAAAVQPPERRVPGHDATTSKWPTGRQHGESAQLPAIANGHPSDTPCPPLSSAPSSMMSTLQKANGMIDSGDLLRQLQDDSMQQISRKHATKKRGKDKDNTTSLKDLDLARAPIDPDRPASSKRTWANDPPGTNNSNTEEYTTATLAREKDSNYRQAPVERSSQTPDVPTQITAPQLARSKWASKDEMKDDQDEVNSNAWGSAAPSDATRDSNISVKSFGKMLDKRGGDLDALLPIDFDGNVMPAPADWDERPRYSNNNPTFKHHFRQWQASVAADPDRRHRFSNGVPYAIIPPDILKEGDLLPDGISMVWRDVTISMANAAYYGYTDDPEDAVKYVRHLSPSDHDDWGKLNPSIEDNRKYKNEKTEDLVSNWLRHLANTRDAFTEVGLQPKAEDKILVAEEDAEPVSEIEHYRPKLNIYLRPATRLDLDELTRIYNCYIANGAGPTETVEIPNAHMADRMRMVGEGHHAFIVAARRNQQGAKEIPLADDDESSWKMGLPVTHKKRITLTRVEMLAGFCCANDLTAPDFVEHISAEIELYVDPQYRNMGVGKCLMDKMLEICDRSHRLTTDCAFHCDQRIRHQYGPGGRRDVHKLVILLRKWHFPKPAMVRIERVRRHRKSAFAKTVEDDYDKWLRKWLESLGFEVEGFLKKIGAKQGRYLDLVYFGRETAWQPAEGLVPGPDPRHVVNVEDADEDDEDGGVMNVE